MLKHDLYDVIIVGAGAAGLTAALRLTGKNSKKLNILVVDGALYPGAENWSGCVYFGQHLAEEEILGENWQNEVAIERKLTARGVFMTNAVNAAGMVFKDAETFKNCSTVLRPVFDNDLYEIARSRGVRFQCDCTVLGLIRDDNNKVIGVSTNNGPYYSKVTYLAEGDASHIAQKEGFYSDHLRDKGHFLQGVKQVVQLAPEVIEERFNLKGSEEGAAYEMIIRNARIGGKEVQLNMGAFIYTNRESLSIGIVLPLDNLAKHFKGSHNSLVEWFLQLPVIKAWTEGGKRVAYGAKIINANGFQHAPQIVDDGLALGGACAGLGLDFPYPNYTGPASFAGKCFAESVLALVESGDDFTKANLQSSYASAIYESQYWKDQETLKDWAGYIQGTKTFFGRFVDVKMEALTPWLNPELSLEQKVRDTSRTVMYHCRKGKLKELRQDLKKQQKAAGASKLGPWSSLIGLFRLSHKKNLSNAEVSMQFYRGEEELSSSLDENLKSLFASVEKLAKPIMHLLYRNHGETLNQRFKNITAVLGSWQFFKTGLAVTLFVLKVLPIAISSLIRDKKLTKQHGSKALISSPSALEVLKSRKAQEVSSIKIEASCEEKLADISYKSTEKSHIRVLWPQDAPVNSDDPNDALWHVCPAAVYRPEQDLAGSVRPVIDYENCVKCESCWRGSDMLDWGRRSNHKIHYTVPSTAIGRVIAHQLMEQSELGSLDSISFELNTLKAHEKDYIKEIFLNLSLYQNKLNNNERLLNSFEHKFLIDLVERSCDIANKLLGELCALNKECSSCGYGQNLQDGLLKIKDFVHAKRYFWADAEITTLKQHTLRLLHIPSSAFNETMHDTHSFCNEFSCDEFERHFSREKAAELRKGSLSNEQKSYLKNLIVQFPQNKEVSRLLASVDLNLAALYIVTSSARAACGTENFPALLYPKNIKVDDGKVTCHVDVVLNAIADEYYVLADEKCWKVLDPSQIESKAIGTIGLRSCENVEMSLCGLEVEEINSASMQALLANGEELFLSAVIGAGETLLEKSLEHANGRVQFPDLFHDERGRDGIAKFGAVKALLSHMICRLEVLKTLDSDYGRQLPLAYRYIQAGKYLGTQEGSLTYNATQVFGGTGFSEDDILSPFYRDASIFKYILGAPSECLSVLPSAKLSYLKEEEDFSFEKYKEASLRASESLSHDRAVSEHCHDLLVRADIDYQTVKAAFSYASNLKYSGEGIYRWQNILNMLTKVYFQSSWNRQRDARSYNSYVELGQMTLNQEILAKPEGKEFNYRQFLQDKPLYKSADYLSKPDFMSNRYCPENLLLDDELTKFMNELNTDFKANFIDKDFDGLNYVRHAEANHGHDDEVISDFHEKGYLNLIIPDKCQGAGQLKAHYYLLINASMRYGDPALSLIIQASTSIGTTPMLLAVKKDIPRAAEELEALTQERARIEKWADQLDQLLSLLKNPDPKEIDALFRAVGDEVKALASKNSVFKSQAAGFLINLHKAGLAGLSFDLEGMSKLLQKALGKLTVLGSQVTQLKREMTIRQPGVEFFLSQISAGQTSAFALTEPSAGSDTARVATRAVLKEVEVEENNGHYKFKIDGEWKTLITPQQCRFHNKHLQVRLTEDEGWSNVCYDKYNFDDDTGYRYFKRGDEEFRFEDIASVRKKGESFIYRYYELTGSKMWITNGRFAGVFSLYAKTDQGVTGFCVDRYTDGLLIGKDEDKMGQNASPTNEIFLDKVRVSTEFVLGLEGRGQVNALETLNVGRAGLSVSALSLSEDMLEAACKYCDPESSRDKAMLGHMAEEIVASQAASYEMVGIFDQPNGDARMESAIGKFMNSEMLHRIILYSESVHGMASQSFAHDVEKKKRDARILNIYEGTNEIQRFLILKDLIEQVSKVEFAKADDDNLCSEEIKAWDQRREQLLSHLKAVKQNIGKKAWMDAGLQPVFFPLSEIAAWLKVADGIIWRQLYWEDEMPELMSSASRIALRRSFAEMDLRFADFNEMYQNILKGIRPPEILLADNYLFDYEEGADEAHGLEHSTTHSEEVVAILETQNIASDSFVKEGQLMSSKLELTPTSLHLISFLKTLPEFTKVTVCLVGSSASRTLLDQLDLNVDKIIFINSASGYLESLDRVKEIARSIETTGTILYPVNNSADRANAVYLSHLLDKKSVSPGKLLGLCQDGKSSVWKSHKQEIETSSPVDSVLQFTDEILLTNEQRYSKSPELIELKIAGQNLTYADIPKAEKLEEEFKDDAHFAADFLGLKLELNSQSEAVDLVLGEVTEINVDKILLLEAEKGKLKKDSLALAQTKATQSFTALILCDGDEELEVLASSLVGQVAFGEAVFVTLDQALQKDLDLLTVMLSKLLSSAAKLYSSFSLSPLLSHLAHKLDKSVHLNVSQITAQTYEILEANSSLIRVCQGEARDYVAFAVNPLASKAELISEIKVSKLNSEIEWSADQLALLKVLNEAKAELKLESLSDAEFIIDVGYGIGNQDNFDDYIMPLYQTLKDLEIPVQIGASRKMIETLKILPPEKQIGQSGCSVAPKILLAVGISGAPQHINYIDSNTAIFSFNLDPSAPLMEMAKDSDGLTVYPITGKLQATLPVFRETLERYA